MTIDDVKKQIAEKGMPAKKEGHAMEVLEKAKQNKTNDVHVLGCFMSGGCLVCCTGNYEGECWVEWCDA